MSHSISHQFPDIKWVTISLVSFQILHEPQHGGRIIDNLQIDNLQIDNRQIDNQNLQIDNLKITIIS